MMRGRTLSAVLDRPEKKAQVCDGSDVFDAAVQSSGHEISLAQCDRQCHAHASVSNSKPMEQQFAQLSTHNLERAFHRFMSREYPGMSLEPYYIWLPQPSSRKGKWKWGQVPMFLISEVLEFIADAGILQLHASIYGRDGLEGIEKCWERAQKCEELRDLCVHACGAAAALIVHFDGVGTFRNNETDVWSFSSVHAASSHMYRLLTNPSLCSSSLNS